MLQLTMRHSFQNFNKTNWYIVITKILLHWHKIQDKFKEYLKTYIYPNVINNHKENFKLIAYSYRLQELKITTKNQERIVIMWDPRDQTFKWIKRQ